MSKERLSIFEGLVALESVLRVEAQQRFIGVSLITAGRLHRTVRIEIADSPVHGWSKEKRQAWRSFVMTMPTEPARHQHAHRVVPEHRFGLQARRDLESSIARSVPSFVPDEPIGEASPVSDGPATLRIDRTECAVWPNEPEAPPSPVDRPFDLRGAGEIHAREGWPAPLLALARAPSDPAARAWVRDAAHVFEAAGESARALEAFAALNDAEGRARIFKRHPRTDSLPVVGASFLLPPRISALLGRGRRVEAAELSEALAREQGEVKLAELAARIRARLALASSLALTIGATTTMFVLAPEAIIGRHGVDVTVAAPVVSRRHLRVRKRDATPIVEELGTPNGTRIEGEGALTIARAIDRPLTLLLGGAIRCSLSPHPAGVVFASSSVERVLTLGPLSESGLVFEANDGRVRVRGATTLDGARIDGPIDATIGDRIRAGDGDVVVVALPNC
jgi:hypothetical protein